MLYHQDSLKEVEPQDQSWRRSTMDHYGKSYQPTSFNPIFGQQWQQKVV